MAEPNETDEELLEKIEVNASWDEALDDFIKERADMFLKYQIPLGDALIVWELNKVLSKLAQVTQKLDEVIEAING